MIIIKKNIDVIALLRQKGYPPGRLRKEKILGESMVQRLRDNEMISLGALDTICEILDCQPGDLIEYVKKQSH